MAEQQDDKQEEKFEFNSAGEFQGYISLEEAGVQAIEYARDNPEFYSSRYQVDDLVWEINSSTDQMAGSLSTLRSLYRSRFRRGPRSWPVESLPTSPSNTLVP